MGLTIETHVVAAHTLFYHNSTKEMRSHSSLQICLKYLRLIIQEKVPRYGTVHKTRIQLLKLQCP